MSEDLRILLVDDQPLLREGIATILGAQPGITVVGQASDGAEAIELLAEVGVDVICMDVEMPGMNGIEATEQITSAQDAPKVLMLTTFGRDDYLLRALQAGASGFLLKTTRPEQLADAIRSVAAGDALLSPEVTRSIIARAVTSGEALPGQMVSDEDGRATPSSTGSSTARSSTGGSSPAGLTPDSPSSNPPQAVSTLTERELQVLALVAGGLSNEEIAQDLVIGRATVKTHVSNVLMKLHLRDRVQAVAFAYRHGLVAAE